MVHPVVVAAALQTGTTAKSMGADVPKAMEHLQVRGRIRCAQIPSSTWYEHSAQLAVLAANGPVVVMPSWGAILWGPERR